MINIITFSKYLFIIACFPSCVFFHKKNDSEKDSINTDSITSIGLYNEDYFKNHIKTEVVFDSTCFNMKEIIPLITTHMVFDAKIMDSVWVFLNNSLIYKQRFDGVFNRIILIHQPSYKKIMKGIPGYIPLDSTKVNEIKICFIERRECLNLKLLKYTNTITINEMIPKWKVNYSNSNELIIE